MKNIIYSLFLVGLITLAIPVQAEIIVEIDVQDSFGLGDSISYTYTLISDNDTQAIIIPHIECPSAPVPPIMEKTIISGKNIPYEDVYNSLVVEDFFETQACTAYVQVLSPIEQIEQKTFAINTNPGFSFVIDICKDQACTQKSKIFLLNENMFLGYDSDVSGLSITATLTYPDKTTEEISLPTSIKADQIGTYTLEVNASKQGYKTITETTQFAVIESEAEIGEFSQSNADNKYESKLKENYATCPQDCPSSSAYNSYEAISDSICDLDCPADEDEAYKEPISLMDIVLVIAMAIGLMSVY